MIDVAFRQKERYHQQKDLINEEILLNSQFLVIGAGAIGSFFATTLAKMGALHIEVIDFDSIEDHNIANQMYPEYMVGTPKVEALASVVKDYAGVELIKVNKTFEGTETTDATFVISAVDNMDVRKKIFEWCKTQPSVKFFLDGRMGAKSIRAYSISMQNAKEVEFYDKSLYPQNKARQERCTAKSIIYTVLLVSGYLLELLSKRINAEPCPVEILFDSSTGCYVATNLEEEKVGSIE